jgi:signal transduction histidine kinase
MNEVLSILLVEDTESDGALIQRVLEKAGQAVRLERVDDAATMRAALTEQTWDAIICDHALPQFNAHAALKLLHETGFDIPFIVVSRAIGEDVAVGLMRLGAHDYLMKGNLARLPVAMDREIREARRRHFREAQRRDSIGLLAGGIAHDFNNILMVVRGNIFLARAELSPGSRADSFLGTALKPIERAARLTMEMLAYAGKGAFAKTLVSASATGEEAVRQLRALTPGNVDIQSDLAASLPGVMMDPGQMRQVFSNLILNAVEAIGETRPGVVQVATSLHGDFVRIVVSDTGSGMDEAVKRQMFEPFFTTKFLGRGLGLAAVDGIVRTLGGRIAVDSEIGRGTRFEVLLPVADASLQEMVLPAAGAETALVQESLNELPLP